MNNVLIEGLIWLGSAAGVAAVAALASKLFEGMAWFKAISSEARHIIIGATVVVVALVGKLAAEWLTVNSDIASTIAPYAQLVYTVIGYISSQAKHGIDKTNLRKNAKAVISDGANG